MSDKKQSNHHHWASHAQRENALEQVSEGKMTADQFAEYDFHWHDDMLKIPLRKNPKPKDMFGRPPSKRKK